MQYIWIVLLIIAGGFLIKILDDAIAPIYDCYDCKKTHKGITTGICPHCGSEKIFGGYGH